MHKRPIEQRRQVGIRHRGKFRKQVGQAGDTFHSRHSRSLRQRHGTQLGPARPPQHLYFVAQRHRRDPYPILGNLFISGICLLFGSWPPAFWIAAAGAGIFAFGWLLMVLSLFDD